MRLAGTPTCGIYRNLVAIHGTHEVLGYSRKSLYNYCEFLRKKEGGDKDAETVMAYLLGKQQNNPSFFVEYTQDEHERLDKLFWCDGQSRNDYKAFGHVLAFDTTYKCNAYRKPFVVLVGVNHNRKTVVFGCALIVDEKTESFVWVLNQMIKAGEGFKPLTVITDGDRAMACAIKEVLPQARHRLCLWHLMRNIQGHSQNGFSSGFMTCVNKCHTIEDFEVAWKELITHHKVEGEKWVEELYDSREKWSEAHMRGYFFGGMATLFI